MSTLFQLHAPINQLKYLVKDMALLWQAGDSILLLGESAAYAGWLVTYIDDLNIDDELDSSINDVAAIYVLEDDIGTLNEEALKHIELIATETAPIHQLTDEAWVALTDKLDRVITLKA